VVAPSRSGGAWPAPLRIILLESGVETVPPELWGHPQVVRTARRYGVEPSLLLLDKSLHYNAMARLSRKWKRGRPDIVHTVLLVLLESRAGRRGLVQVYMHTIDGSVYEFDPRVRIPKNYERFRGLMAHLVRNGRVPPEGKPLIWRRYTSLAEFRRAEGPIILLWERGSAASEAEIVARSLAEGAVLGIGAFPRGDFERSTLRHAGERYSIAGGEPLPAWSVACRLLCAYEEIIGL
jgi:rRNA small subunit pseudouridine methyltransferase Nep1